MAQRESRKPSSNQGKPVSGSWTALMAVLVAVLLVAEPAAGLWMPWATEEDKIKKTINDIWSSFVRGDRKAAEQHIAGPAAKLFARQEFDYIKKMKITQYFFRIRHFKVDPVKGEWAWVGLERVAIMINGGKKTMLSMLVFRKTKGQWKLYARARKNKKRQEKKRDFVGPSAIMGASQGLVRASGGRSILVPTKEQTVVTQDGELEPPPKQISQSASNAGTSAAVESSRSDKASTRGWHWIKGPPVGPPGSTGAESSARLQNESVNVPPGSSQSQTTRSSYTFVRPHPGKTEGGTSKNRPTGKPRGSSGWMFEKGPPPAPRF